MLLTRTELALAKFASKDASRLTLQSIAVEKDLTAVTDGNLLLTVAHSKEHKDEDYPPTPGLEMAQVNGEPLLVDATAALAALKALPRKTTIPILAFAALGTDRKLVVNTLESIGAWQSTHTGQFPNWRVCMPTGEPKVEIYLDASLLASLAEFIAQHGDDRMPGVRLTIYDADRPVRMDARTAEGEDITAILMPIRGEATKYPVR